MTKKEKDPVREPSRKERIAFYSAWAATGFLTGWANSFILFGFIGAGIGLFIAWVFELEPRSIGGFFWHDLPPRLILLWIVAGLFMIVGAVFGINTGTSIVTGILLGLKIGCIHGTMLAFIPQQNIKWLWTFPAVGMAIGMGIGLFASGWFAGYVGLLIALFLVFLFEMEQINEYTDLPSFGTIILWFALYGVMIAADILGIEFGMPVEGSSVAFSAFVAYTFVLFFSRQRYEHQGDVLKTLQKHFDEAFPTQDEVSEQPAKVEEAIASIATALEYYTKHPWADDKTPSENLGEKWEQIKPLWRKFNSREISLRELLVQVAREQGIDAFKTLVGNISYHDQTTWH